MGYPKGWSSDDWYKEGEGQLHFFPHQKRLVWTIGLRIVYEAEAWGGEMPQKGMHYPQMKPRPTTPGTYVISGHGPYKTRTWPWSRIAWGTVLALDSGGGHLLYETGQSQRPWRRVEDLIPGATIGVIREAFWQLYADSRLYDSNRDGIPDVWVFNDFGPWAVRYYKDPNRNRQLDRGEHLMGEMIHTNPGTEAETDRGLAVKLSPSHGCIHVKPLDLSNLLKIGAFAAGNLVVVHGPAEVVPERLMR